MDRAASVAITRKEFRERGAYRGGKTYVWILDDNGRLALKRCEVLRGK